MTGRPTVSLIATVKNERTSLDAWLAGIERQSRVPDEIIIVDGGSDDGTWEALSSWQAPCNLMLFQSPGASISAGRNHAIRAAHGDIIAVTDAGTVADNDWLDALCQPFGDASVDVSCGFFRPSVEGVWARALAAATLPDADEICPGTFLPSSRSVAIRSSWVRSGFEYPEWLDYCEDVVWDLQLRRAGARFVLSSGAIVGFSMRPNWRAFWKQYYLYARGDGKAGLFGKRHLIRYLVYVAATLALFRRRKAELFVCAVAGCAYVHRPMTRLLRRDKVAEVGVLDTLRGVFLIPLHRLIGDLAKMAGYPVGLGWRWSRYGFAGLRGGWQRIRPDGTIWNPSSSAVENPPPEV